ncbi:hypothetical protein HYPSUDRAFT_63515 [Hypholoma sublateritium FD-334 SS-4]|uniref:C2 domain-containing protein n=1 Tax=Hypholoma sublateritium (strain FD-334 SS-4) TaxID=945553 RepID=A0A0D2PDW0_HYPSF|nr:hypothetical protein HYPSUDRAFT_63515 [Hypholoma sublateritium FD-334 SS-4]
MSTTEYELRVLNAPEIVWDTVNIRRPNPNPYVEISAAGQKLHATAVQSRTVTPVWNENLIIQSRDPESMLKVELYHSSTRSGGTRPIGSTKIRIQDLVDLAKLSNEVSLELFDNGVRRATLIIQFKKIDPPIAPAVSQGSRLGVNHAASEISPGTAKARLNQAPSRGMSQAEKFIQQMLSGSSAGNVDTPRR